MKDDQNLMLSLLDVEINSAEADAFGHRHFAKALQSLIESPTNQPPYSIGLLGKWGTGKSSIKSIYLAALEDDLSKNSGGEARANRIRPITFNAWRFGGENIKRALLRHVYLALGGDSECLKDALFRQVQRPVQEARTWKSIFKDAYEKWIWGALQVFLVLVVLIIGVLLTGLLFGYSDPWVIAAINAVFGACALLLTKYLFDPKRLFIPRYMNINKLELPSSSAEEYEDLLLDQLKIWKAGNGKKCERLLIFVDDLDRLSAEEMVSGLDAVRTFMEIPKTQIPNGVGIVFVISCDEERIAEALADRRRQRSADLPGSVMTAIDARRFLDRIFQFRLEIPQFPKRDMRNYAMKRLQDDLPGIAKDLRDRGVVLETIIDRMIHVGVQSPRNALQILNAFAQSWWIAQQREREGAGTEKPGGLHEGAVTSHPLSLAALSALRVDFADFYEDLQTEPDLIKRFTDVFVVGKKLDDQPEATKAVLGEYVNSEGLLKPEYRGLRQFIAGLQGLRWPISIQALLILSEDPVTRKFGDKAPRLYDAFVSGDQAGVLAELGRDADAKSLSHEDVRLLHDMEEELRHESTTKRDNAARVIAALADRLPDDQAHLLISPLARRLARSPKLRSFIGIPRIQTLLPKALADDRRDVAAQLIEDLLRTEDEIDFTLPTGEAPSLDETIEIVKCACAVVLTVRSQDSLDIPHDRLFLDWLESRTLSSGGENHEFPFSDLETWMAQHERDLLPDLKQRYTRLAIAQLEQGDLEGIDVAETLRRTRIVFDELWNAGQESREELWNQLNRLVSVRQESAVSLAWEFLSLHLNAPESKIITVFVKNMAERLQKDMDESGWELDWEAGGRALLNLLDVRLADIGNHANDALASLAVSWSGNTDTAQFAVRLLTLLLQKDKVKAAAIIDDWTNRVIKDLPDEAIVWLARAFESLTAEQQAKVSTSLNPIHNRTKISEQESKDFITFMRHLSDEAIKATAMQEFLGELYPFVQQQHGNPNQYLDRIFPALPRIIHFGPATEAGTMLHTLFANARNSLPLYAWLHEQMTGCWPPQSAEMSPYDPSQIFAATVQTIREYPSDNVAPRLLNSARTMIKDGRVEKENESQVIESACLVWSHHQADALSVFQSYTQIPATAAIRALMDSVEYENEDSRDNLQQAWAHFSDLLSEEQVNEIAKLILAEGPKGSSEEPDAPFRLWIEVQKGRKSFLLRSLILDQSLNDSQRKRVWLQIEKFASEIGKDALLSELPKIFGLGDSTETLNAVFESNDIFGELFSTASDKYKLATSLVESFAASSSKDAKNKLAQWLKNIDGASALKELKGVDGVSDDDLDILREQFPQSKALKQIKESRQSAE